MTQGAQGHWLGADPAPLPCPHLPHPLSLTTLVSCAQPASLLCLTAPS